MQRRRRPGRAPGARPQAGAEVAAPNSGVRRAAVATAASASSSSAGHQRSPEYGCMRLVPADRREPATARGCRRRRRPAGRRTRRSRRRRCRTCSGCVEVSWAATRAVAGEDPAAQRQPDARRRSSPATASGKATRLTATSAPSTTLASRASTQGGGQRRVPADGGGAHQLVAAALLLGAGVPADQEHAHQPGHDRAERRGLPRHLAADGVERAGRAGHRDEGGVALPCSPAALSNSAWVV